MIADTSAIVAIVREEPEASRCLDSLLGAPVRRMSAGNMLEACLVIDGARSPETSAKLDMVIGTLRLVIEPVTHDQVQIAREAFRQYGRGSGHPARLNFGDCFAYALARAMDEPLLFVGNDFGRTDIRRAL